MSQPKEQSEKRFLKGMEVLQSIETEMNNMLQSYSDGQLSLGLASFQNEDLHHLLKPKSFRVGCASLLVSNSQSKDTLELVNPPKEQLKFIYTDCASTSTSSCGSDKKQSKMFSIEEDFDEEYYKEEKQKIETEAQTKGSDPLAMLGITFPSQAVLNAQSSMRKVLESALKITNILTQAQKKQ